MSEQSLEFAVNKEWYAPHKENPWLTFVPEFAQDAQGQKFMKPKGRQIVYRVVKENVAEGIEEYVCNTCESSIQGARIAHPIWDGPVS